MVEAGDDGAGGVARAVVGGAVVGGVVVGEIVVGGAGAVVVDAGGVGGGVVGAASSLPEQAEIVARSARTAGIRRRDMDVP